MNKKIFAFDVDGTIFTSENKIHPHTLKMLYKAKDLGHMLVLASGRGEEDMREVTKQAPNLFEYLVCNNGAYIYNESNGEIIMPRVVDKKWINKVIEVGTNVGAFFIVHTTKGAKRSQLFNKENWPSWYDRVINEEFHKFPISETEDLLKHVEEAPLAQISLRADENAIASAIKQLGSPTDVDIHVANEVYIDVNPVDTSKLSGLQALCDIVGHDIKDVIAFGDSGNDLQMLKGVGVGHCMENGSDLAKAAADKVVGNNNTGTIGETIEEYL